MMEIPFKIAKDAMRDADLSEHCNCMKSAQQSGQAWRGKHCARGVETCMPQRASAPRCAFFPVT